MNSWQQFTYQEAQNLLINKTDISVLEIGVGPSGLIYHLSKKFKNNNYYGLDLDQSVLNFMKKEGITGYSVDISNEEAPFENNFFDIIIMNEVIEHIFDCQSAINEIYRILKKGGTFIISTHNTFNLFMRIKYLLGIIPCPSLDVTHETMGEHIRLFNKKILLKLLYKSGFLHKNIEDKSWFKFGNISFYTHIFTSLFAIHLHFICKK